MYKAAMLGASLALGLSVGVASASPKSSWAALDALPNFTEGVWGTTGPGGPQAIGAGARGLPPLKPGIAPGGAGRSDPADAAAAGESCTPLGLPTVMLRPYPFEFLYSPGRITLLLELDGQVRRIFTDGRRHPEDPDPTYGGHSIGHWEGGTLVVDTVGILPEVQVSPGVPIGDGAHIVERMHLTAPDVLTIDTTIEAPAVLARPWSYSMSYPRHRDWSVMEYFCAQNPRTTTDDSGRTILDLSPPK